MMNLGPGNEGNSSSNVRGRQVQRLTVEQRQRLEEVFQNLPNPPKEVQQTLSQELNLEVKQIKSWFQNRRTRKKNENDRANVDALKLENERLLEENKKLRTENVQLKQCDRWPQEIDNVPAEQNPGTQLSLTGLGSPYTALEGDTQLSLAMGAPNTAIQGASPHLAIMPRRSSLIVDFARRMSRSFWEILGVYGKFEDRHLPYVCINDVQVSVRFNDIPSIPSRFILGASASQLMDVSHVTLFDFFHNHRTRFQWNFYCDETSSEVIDDICLGTHPRDRVSIYQASRRGENSTYILQECAITSQGFTIVYAPIHSEWLTDVLNGVNPSYIPLLPVGFMISEVRDSGVDGAPTSSSSTMPGRSFLSMFFQMFVGSVEYPAVSIEDEELIKNTVASNMQRIKGALSG